MKTENMKSKDVDKSTGQSIDKNMETNGAALAPISSGERIQIIDILRGIAIFGILLVNIQWMAFPAIFNDIYKEMYNGPVDKLVRMLIDIFVSGKFMTMFSLLFGLGVAVQVSRAIEKGKKFAPFYIKRLLALLVVALIHDLLIWNGMILLMYAVLGFVLIPFAKRKPKTLLTWAIIFIVCNLLVFTGMMIVFSPPTPPPAKQQIAASQGQPAQPVKVETEAEKKAKVEKAKQERLEKCEETLTFFRTGSFPQLVSHRVGELVGTGFFSLRLGFYIMGIFLLGLWVWKRGILHDIEANLGFLKKAFWISLAVGIPATAAYLAISLTFQFPYSFYWAILFTAIKMVAWPSMCFFLMISSVFIYRLNWGKMLLKPIAAVGRTALTNYIAQSIICTTLFYSHGFGLMGKTSPLGNALIVCAVFAVQVPISVWWMGRFRFGPVEWLWRSLTYGKIQGFLKK